MVALPSIAALHAVILHLHGPLLTRPAARPCDCMCGNWITDVTVGVLPLRRLQVTDENPASERGDGISAVLASLWSVIRSRFSSRTLKDLKAKLEKRCSDTA